MTRRSLWTTVFATALLVPLSIAGFAGSATAGQGSTHRDVPVCSAPSAGSASCHAVLHETIRPDGSVAAATATPSGYGPADLQSAYQLPSSTSGVGQTVAIVDAYNDPNVLSDLCVYRVQYHLPPVTGCAGSTTSSPTFRVVSQSGRASLPKSNGGWAEEISLDVDMVSAICPSCNILLVEASSSSLTDLGTAVNEAATLHATEISNSYGGSESKADPSYDTSYYNHPGIAITASSGDSGYGASYPAASHYVTSVGGTTLTRSTSARGWSETAWSGAGSGCSSYDAQPSWQASLSSIKGVCAQRAVADVSAVTNPSTGVAVYDSYRYQGLSGWLVFGGTSVSSPIIASVYALAGNANAVNYGSFPYSNVTSLNDVTSGSNGSCGNLLCNAITGWDGPTGLGTPNGTGAF